MGCVIITGAAGGIGRTLVDVFAGAGHEVIATDVAEVPTDLPADYLACDIGRTTEDPGYAESTFAEIRKLVGARPLDALINNAAVQVLEGSRTLGMESWRRTLNVNLLAPFLWTQALLPDLESSGGCVVNVSSIHARLTKPGFVAYATSKAALSALTRAMAVDLGPAVRINAIEPAAIATDLLKEGFKSSPGRFSDLEKHHPSGRIGRPREVAQLALSLVNRDLGFVHGTCIGIDGGIGAALSDPDNAMHG